MQAAFGSWRLAAAAFALLPAALSGGVLVLALTGTDLSLGALLGLLAVLGLAVRTTVLSVRRSQALGTVQLAADDRLAPVVTSAIAVTACFLPLLVLGPRAGLEIVHPLAVALLGGLVTSTAVALFALPAACMRLGYSAGAPGGPVVRQWTPDEAAQAPVVAERR
jgi:Cu/Ag efflux pump CusA